MHILIHIVIHVIIRLRAVLVSKQFAKTVRKNEGDDLLIQILKNSKRLLHPFQALPLLFCEFVFSHTQNAALLADPPSIHTDRIRLQGNLHLAVIFPKSSGI